MKAALFLLCLLSLAGCKRQDMATQAKAQTWDRSSIFDNQQSMRHPVPGTLARGEPNQPVAQPATIDAALLARGQQRFDIFCTPCHGRAGDGLGMIVQRGFPQPPSFHTERLRQASAQHLFDVITNGQGAMASYGDRVAPPDRWAVIAYIRALQISQDADVTALSPSDRTQLGRIP